eukprot:gene1322-biopygen10849
MSRGWYSRPQRAGIEAADPVRTLR